VLCRGLPAALLLRLPLCPMDTIPLEAGAARPGSVFLSPARSRCSRCESGGLGHVHGASEPREDLGSLQGASPRYFCLRDGEDRGKSTVITANVVVPASRA